MSTLVIEGIPGLDGEYDTDLSYFTNREWRTIKEIAGVRVGEFMEAQEAGDNDLVVAFAVITLRRNNVPVDVNDIWDAEAGRIRLKDTAVAGDDALPPENEPGVNAETGDAGTRSATTSAPTGDTTPVSSPVVTGIPA